MHEVEISSGNSSYSSSFYSGKLDTALRLIALVFALSFLFNLCWQLTGPGQLGEGADGSFALIYTCLALHHVRDCTGTLSALAGYLRPGGRLLLFDFEATKNSARFHPPEFEVRCQESCVGCPA